MTGNEDKIITCLVTGAAGELGSQLTDLLVKHGYEVYMLDDLSTGDPEKLNKAATFIKGDVRDLSLFNMLKPVDYVFHLVDCKEDDIHVMHSINVTAVINILEYCNRHGSKLVFKNAYVDSPLYLTQKFMAENYVQHYENHKELIARFIFSDDPLDYISYMGEVS